MLGLLVGFLSLTVSGAYTFDCLDTTEVDTDGKESKQKSEETVISSFDAITSSSAEFSFNHESFLIEVLPELDDQEDAKSTSQSLILTFDKISKILFQRIISPNAP